MKLKTKYTLLFSTCGALFILTAFIIFGRQLRVVSNDEAIIHAEKHLALICLNIEELINYEIDMAQQIASNPVIRELLAESNSIYTNYTDDERKKLLTDMDKEWKQSNEEDDMVRALLNSKLSDSLNLISSNTKNHYGEIFITNKYGVASGSTSKLTTVVHDYKYWWKQAFSNGTGKVFIDDRGFDSSAGAYVLGFVIPVISSNEIIGVLKCNVNIEHLFDKFVKYEDALGEQWQIIVARSKGKIIYKEGIEPLSESLSEEIMPSINLQSPESLATHKNYDDSLYVFESIKSTTNNENYNFGGTAETIDHSKGNTGENWHIIATVSTKSLHHDMNEVLLRYFIFALMMTILYVIIAFFISNKLSKNIEMLKIGIKKISDGDLHTRILDYPNDETGEIAESINDMANHLSNSLTSKKELQSLVDEKQKLLKEFNHRVKNNLTLISSFIELKKANSKCEVDLTDIQKQINTINFTHELLIESDDFYEVNFKNYFEKLIDSLFMLYRNSIKIESRIGIDEINVNTAKILGLIINETAINTIKYSGHQNNEVKYIVELTEDSATEKMVLVIRNTGEPIHNEIGLDNPTTLGLQIITGLTKQLRGSIKLERSPHPTFTIIIPKE